MARKINRLIWNKSSFNINSTDKRVRDAELLTFILSLSKLPKKRIHIIIEKLLSEFNDINNLIHADKDKIMSVKGVDESTYIAFATIREILARSLSEQITNKNIISCWSELLNYLKFTLGFNKVEHFRVLFLNSKNVIIADEFLGIGGVNQTPVYVRGVIKRILFHEAFSVILIHNHPSGDPNPSKQDINITMKIVEACRVVDTRVLDHIIIGGNNYYSFNETFNTKGDISSCDLSLVK